jgi:hypothetical protein
MGGGGGERCTACPSPCPCCPSVRGEGGMLSRGTARLISICLSWMVWMVPLPNTASTASSSENVMNPKPRGRRFS